MQTTHTTTPAALSTHYTALLQTMQEPAGPRNYNPLPEGWRIENKRDITLLLDDRGEEVGRIEPVPGLDWPGKPGWALTHTADIDAEWDRAGVYRTLQNAVDALLITFCVGEENSTMH